MKFIHISFHFEYGGVIEKILDSNEVKDYVRYPMIESKDCDGKHFGTQVYPGNASVIQAMVEEEKIEKLFAELEDFKTEKKSHHHLRAVVLPLEREI